MRNGAVSRIGNVENLVIRAKDSEPRSLMELFNEPGSAFKTALLEESANISFHT